MIDMSGVTEYAPVYVGLGVPAAFIIVAVWGFLYKLPGAQQNRLRRSLSAYSADMPGPFDKPGKFFVFMANSLILGVALSGLTLMAEISIWDTTSSESAVFSSEVSRLYGISIDQSYGVDENGTGVGTDAEGLTVMFRYDPESGTLEFPKWSDAPAD